MEYTFPNVYRDNSGGGSAPSAWEGTIVRNWAQLVAAATANKRLIQFGADITTEPTGDPWDLIVSEESTLSIFPYKLVQGGTDTIYIGGHIDVERRQIFSGFLKGQIQGTFCGQDVLPEWWGMIGGTNAFGDGEHDLAINCALASGGSSGYKVTVSLGRRPYFIKRPIDMRNTAARLKGCGQASTKIFCTTTFDPGEWEFSEIFSLLSVHQVRPVTFDSAATADGGLATVFTVGAAFRGSLNDFYPKPPNGPRQKARLSGFTPAAYNGDWDYLATETPLTIRLGVAYAGPITVKGVMRPITLDSEMETGANSHSAMIWFGRDVTIPDPVPISHFTGIEGVCLDAFNATQKWPKKRISCIAWLGNVEESSYIRDFIVGGFSGFGIGGEAPSPDFAQLNGFTIEQGFFGHSTRRFSLPIYLNELTIEATVRSITIPVGLSDASLTRDAAVPPAYILELPHYGIFVAGIHVLLDSIHIEGPMVPYCLALRHISCGAQFNCCDHQWTHSWPMAWSYDWDRAHYGLLDMTKILADDNYFGSYTYHYSTGVALGGYPNNYYPTSLVSGQATLQNVVSLGAVDFVLRDVNYGIHLAGLGHGWLPSKGNMKHIAFYARGDVYGPATPIVLSNAEINPGDGKTLLTVADSSPFVVNGGYFISASNRAQQESYNAPANGWLVKSKPDATHLVIDKPFTIPVTGHIWKPGPAWTTGAPLTDKAYFTGPIY